MLLVALFWGWALVVSLGLGMAAVRCLRVVAGPLPKLLTDSPELLCLTGLATLTWLVAILSFSLPVGPAMQYGLSALAITTLLVCRVELKQLLGGYGQSWWAAGIGGVCLAGVLATLVLVHAAQRPIFPDSALYHAQFVQWLHSYPVVPGLGNLHSRLAFNSHAHLLTAFFSPVSPPHQWPAFQQTSNSFSFLLLMLYHVRRAVYHLRLGKQQWLTGFYLGSLLLLMMSLRPWISSPLPDGTVAVFGLFVLGFIMETPRLQTPGLVWLVVLATVSFTCKASAAVLLLWPAILVFQLPFKRRLRSFSILASIGLLVALPWLGRNIILSGYLTYPLAGQIGPLVAEWAVPQATSVADVAEIQLFARRPVGDWNSVAGQSWEQWLPFWWHQQEPADQRLLFLVLLGVMLFLSGLAVSSFPHWWHRSDYQIYLLLLFGCGIWFVVAPALRFGYVYLIGAAVLGPLLVMRTYKGYSGNISGWILGILSLVYGVNGLVHELLKPGTLSTYLVFPADYSNVAGIIPLRRLGQYQLYMALNGRCGNHPIPCAESSRLNLVLRDSTLQQGFRTKYQQ